VQGLGTETQSLNRPDQLTALPGALDHPLRRALIEELHVRRFPPFAAPAQMMQFVMSTGDTEIGVSRQHAEKLCAHFGQTVVASGRYFSATLPRFHFVWEQHTEFCSYSLIAEGAFDVPFPLQLLDWLPAQWLQTLPGRTLRATQIALLGRDSPEPDDALLASLFSIDELVCCDVQEGEARIWSNFRVHGDGLGRLLVRDQALVGPGDTSRLLQRLQELGNYRNVALLGLPMAQQLGPALAQLEQQLTEVAREIAGGGIADETLLQRLSILSADLAKMAAETRFRFGATRAYSQLVADRLQAIQVRRVPGFQTLIDFTERRLVPAVRTCESFSQRLDDLSTRVSWASSMMRTRIETALEHQSRDLLESMNQRASAQLRLQQTVVGLSVMAISYYAIGLTGYFLKPLAELVPGLNVNLLVAAITPVAIGIAWYTIRRIRGRLDGAH
jgi:uncharacterized membrane-anchored protein